MSVVPIRWRPLGSRDLSAVQTRLTGAISSWQARWFSKPFLSVETVALLGPADGFVPPATSSTWVCIPDVWLSAPARAFPNMLNRALDLPRSLVLPGAAAVLIDEVKTRLVDSLFAAISATLSPGTQAFESMLSGDATAPLHIPYGAVHFRVATNDGETLLSIICGARTFWEMLPIPANAGAISRPSFRRRTEAVEETRVSLAASLGTCELTVPQLATLAVGDVITLDCQIGDSIPVTLTGSNPEPRPLVAMGKPGQTAGKLSIQLTSVASPNTP